MRIKRYIFFIVWGLLATACAERTVCPAYQSAFMLDEELRDKHFSLFVEDSLPKEDLLVYKDNRGLMAGISYHGKKLKDKKRLNLVEAETIYPTFDESQLDSVMIASELDSVMEGGEIPDRSRATLKWASPNRDQEIYEELFGDILYAKPGEKKPQEEVEEDKPNWFQRLFRKKEKSDEGEEDLPVQPAEDEENELKSEVNEDMAFN